MVLLERTYFIADGPGYSEEELDALYLGCKEKLGFRKVSGESVFYPLIQVGRSFIRTIHLTPNLDIGWEQYLWYRESGGRPCAESSNPLLKVLKSDEEESTRQAFWKVLKKLPALKNSILHRHFDRALHGKTGTAVLRYIFELMKKAAISARDDDVRSLKKKVLKHVLVVIKNHTSRREIKELAKLKDNQSKRGFRCAAIGGLLCPAGLAERYNNPITFKDTQAELLMGSNQNKGRDFPVFAYGGCKVYPEDWDRGLFEGDMMYMALRHIFLSPTSAFEEGFTCSGKSLMNLYSIREITKHMILYSLILCHYALSSHPSWETGFNSFSYLRLYHYGLNTFDGDAKFTEKVLKYWDEQVYGSGRSSSAEEVAEFLSPWEEMVQQRAERRRRIAAGEAPKSVAVVLPGSWYSLAVEDFSFEEPNLPESHGGVVLEDPRTDTEEVSEGQERERNGSEWITAGDSDITDPEGLASPMGPATGDSNITDPEGQTPPMGPAPPPTTEVGEGQEHERNDAEQSGASDTNITASGGVVPQKDLTSLPARAKKRKANNLPQSQNTRPRRSTTSPGIHSGDCSSLPPSPAIAHRVRTQPARGKKNMRK